MTPEPVHSSAPVPESEILARLLPRLPESARAEVGPGDDAAVVRAMDGRTVITTDMMIHGPDFRLAWSTPYDLGWKAAASNLADVAAMGAQPTALVVALALTEDDPAGFAEGFADGMREACAALAPGCGVVGGDLSVSDTLTIAVTAIGDLGGRAPVLRSGARPGDVLALAGAAGDAARGLAALFRYAVDAEGTPDAERARALRLSEPQLIGAQLTPTPPIVAGPRAAAAGATSMLDVSDGLALDASRIARASGVALDITAAALGEHPEAALHGGEDHALLATFPAGTALPKPFRAIGLVREGAGVLLDGNPVDPSRGWDPYAQWDGQAG